MSVKHIGLILDHFVAPAPLKLVAIILADHSDAEGLSWPSYRTIAKRANMSERSVQRHVKTLQEIGVITKVRSGTITKESGKPIRISNAYRMHVAGIMMAPKLSTELSTPGGKDDKDDYLQPDTADHLRATPVTTKPSINHQLNRQRSRNSKPVNKSREPITLDIAIDRALKGIK